ncbi:YidB family protein [Streptomyces griseus]|uniref:YidB family protein n=1 Tax=Streptomyces griseus TaxID=1911 RepID=UPI0008405B73|nr:YidB family protein [Streptomyces griseus]
MSETTMAPVLGQLLTALAAAPGSAAKFESWTSQGANQPLTAEEVAAAAPAGMLKQLAELAQVSEAEAAASLAEEIPALVDVIPAATIEAFRAAAKIAALTPEEEAAAEQIVAEARTLAAALPQSGSWLGYGPNEPLTEEQLVGALGEDKIAEAAAARGLDRSEVVAELTRTLPMFIDAVSPYGWVDVDVLRFVLAQDDVNVTSA